MQNKKSLLQRLLVIYVTFFIVVLASIAYGVLPGFSRGVTEGSQLGNAIVKSWATGRPRMIYKLGSVPVQDDAQEIIVGDSTLTMQVRVAQVDLTISRNAPGASMQKLAFSALGGSPWIYALVMLNVLFLVAVIVLMFLIIHSLRRSIREERTLDRRNVWLLRIIGGLTIVMEFIRDTVDWYMADKASDLLAGHGYTVVTGFQVSYSTLIMGILVLFAAEVFAIGQNLSEEQKLTI